MKRPVARPVALSSTQAFEPVNGVIRDRSANDSRTQRDLLLRRSRLDTAVIEQVRATLTERDHDVVKTLAQVHVATGLQLERLHYVNGSADTSGRRARRALMRLVRLRVLARLERRVGGARRGSQGFVYALDLVGQHVASQGALARRRRRPFTPSRPFLTHRLAITELLVGQCEAAREGRLELLEFQAEPACWRTFVGRGGGRTVLKPDAFVRTAVSGWESGYFVEVDCATESVPAIARKLAAYRAYRSSGREERTLGYFPRALFLVPTEERRRILAETIARQPAEWLDMFRVGLLSDATHHLASREEVTP